MPLPRALPPEFAACIAEAYAALKGLEVCVELTLKTSEDHVKRIKEVEEERCISACSRIGQLEREAAEFTAKAKIKQNIITDLQRKIVKQGLDYEQLKEDFQKLKDELKSKHFASDQEASLLQSEIRAPFRSETRSTSAGRTRHRWRIPSDASNEDRHASDQTTHTSDVTGGASEHKVSATAKTYTLERPLTDSDVPAWQPEILTPPGQMPELCESVGHHEENIGKNPERSRPRSRSMSPQLKSCSQDQNGKQDTHKRSRSQSRSSQRHSNNRGGSPSGGRHRSRSPLIRRGKSRSPLSRSGRSRSPLIRPGGTGPASKRWCFMYVLGNCAKGSRCQERHPGHTELAEIRDNMRKIPCRNRPCTRSTCLFLHADD